MAVPTNARILRGTPLKTGVILGISPSSDPTFDVELARASSSGSYTTLGRLTPKGSGIPVSYTDLLPDDNAIRLYKARAVKDGWEPGDYTSVVSAKPQPLPEISPNITPVTGKPLGVSVFMSNAAPTAYGSPASTGAFEKMSVLAGTDFIGITNSVPYRTGANFGSLRPTTANSSTQFVYVANAQIPIGVTVYGVEALYRRGSTNAVFAVALDSIGTTGNSITRYQKTSTSIHATQGLTLASSSFSFTNENTFITLRSVMRCTTADASSGVELIQVAVKYKTANLNKTI